MKLRKILFSITAFILLLVGCSSNEIKPTKISAVEKEINLLINTERDLNDLVSFTFEPKEVSNQDIEWSTTINDIFTLNDSIIKANKVGSAIVTARSILNKDLKEEIKVNVIQTYPVFVLDKEGYEIKGLGSIYEVGKIVSFEVITIDNTKSIKEVRANDEVLTSLNGSTYSFIMPNEKVIIKVSLKESKKATNVTLNNEYLELKVGENAQLNAIVTPNDTTDLPIWNIIEGEDVINIIENNNEVNISAIKEGTAKVKVIYNETTSAECNILVKEEDIIIEGLPTSIELKVDEEITLTPSLNKGEGTFTFESKDSLIASVNEEGLIKGLVKGNTIITIRSVEYSELFKEVNINVIENNDINTSEEITSKYNINYDLGEKTTAQALNSNEDVYNTFEFINGEEIINSVSQIEYIYGGGYGGSGDNRWSAGNMLKFGTTSVNGSLTLELNKEINYIKITGYVNATSAKIRVGDSTSLDWTEESSDEKTTLFTCSEMTATTKEVIEANNSSTIMLEFEKTNSLKIATTNKKPLYITSIEFGYISNN